MKRNILYFIGLLLVGFAFYVLLDQPSIMEPSKSSNIFSDAEYRTLDKSKALSDQTVIVKMGKRVFEFPKEFVQSNISGKKEMEAINLVYVMPDFSSRARFSSKQAYQKARKQKKMAHMLFRAPGTRAVEPSTAIRRRSKTIPKIKNLDNLYGLERQVWYRKRPEGLIPYYDMYIERDKNGRINSYIECSQEERVPSPGCSHHFFDKGYDYDIYYNKKKFLRDWRKHRENAIAYIDGFEIKEDE